MQQHISPRCAFCFWALTEFGIEQNQPEGMTEAENCCFCFFLKWNLIQSGMLMFIILVFDQFIIEDFNMGRDPDAVAAIASTSWPGRSSEQPSSGGSSSLPKSSFPQSKNASLRTLQARFQTLTLENGIPKRFYPFIDASAEEPAAQSPGSASKIFLQKTGNCELYAN